MASRSWNRVALIGNLTRDPELRFTPNGAAVCTFGMATNRTYVSEGEKKEEVDFHRLVSWNKLAELCNQLLKKGHRVFISGRLQTRSWEAQDGTQRQTTEIVIEDMILLTPKSANGESAYTSNIDIDELPTKRPAQAVSKPQVEEPEGEKEPAEKKEEVEKTESKKESEEKEADESTPESEDKEKPKASKQAPKEDVDDLPF